MSILFDRRKGIYDFEYFLSIWGDEETVNIRGVEGISKDDLERCLYYMKHPSEWRMWPQGVEAELLGKYRVKEIPIEPVLP